MMNRFPAVPVLAGFVVICAQPLSAATKEAATSVPIGSKIERVPFKDIRYLPRTLDEFKEKKAYVIVFTTVGCPLVQRYLGRIGRLEKTYRAKGVQFIGINVGPADSIADAAEQAIEHQVEFTVGKDFDGQSVRALGVSRTPEVVILDKEFRLRYRGRVDDQYRFGGVRPNPTRNDLQEALDEVLAGEPVSVSTTPVDGCLITASEPPPSEVKAVTFSEHIAPLMKKHCQECHRSGTEAPFSLVTYEQVTGQAEMIAEVVTEQRMPPWFASRKHGTFANERRLSPEERDQILTWVSTGMKQGDPGKLPEPIPPVENGWLIGEPDLVLKAPWGTKIPAEGYVSYKYIPLVYVFPEDTWVQRIEIRPETPRVLHHCNLAYVQEGKKFRREDNFLTGKVPGSHPTILGDGKAILIPKGATLWMQVHYVTVGKKTRDRLSLGLVFAKEPVHKRVRSLIVNNKTFEIPPGAPAHAVKADQTLDCDATGLALFSHMHLRGRDMTFLANYPSGRTETLLVIPNYNFDWQMTYYYPPNAKKFPKGTRFECIAHYDNTSFNPYNPDPTATVRDGEQTYHEMMYGFVFYTEDAEDLNLRIDPKTGHVLEKRADRQVRQ